MADISQITLPNNSSYDIKDAVARETIDGLDIIAAYDSSTKTVTLSLNQVASADSKEY